MASRAGTAGAGLAAASAGTLPGIRTGVAQRAVAVNGNPTATHPYRTNPDNPMMTAGSTFVGQFTDHDITFDQTSQLGVTTNPLTSPNTQTPALDLDPVFGGGLRISPGLYVANPYGTAGPQLRIGSGGVHEDLTRTLNGDRSYTAIVSDPRNDENVMIGGLHCAHILFYNRVLSELAGLPLSWFPAARGVPASRLSSAHEAQGGVVGYLQ